MRRKLLLALFLFICATSTRLYAVENNEYRLFIPDLRLMRGAEWIENIKLTVICGHIEAIGGIPLGWSISIVRMDAETEKLRAEADHGATRLAALGKLNEAIRINVLDSTCFDMSAELLISGEHERQIRLPRDKLKLTR